MKETKKYTARQVADMLGISVATLHYYEKTDLIPPIERNITGYRIYSQLNIEWLQMIVMMREVNIPITDIRQYSQLLREGSATIPERYNIINKYKDEMEKKIEMMIASLRWLNAKANFYQEAMEKEVSYQTFQEESLSFKQSTGLTADFSSNIEKLKNE